MADTWHLLKRNSNIFLFLHVGITSNTTWIQQVRLPDGNID